MAAFLATIVVGIVITNYQYGGKAYYMRIDNSPTITHVDVPVGTTVRGYAYQGTARDAQGQTKKLKFTTNERDISPFRKGQQVKIMVNKNFGVVGYQRVQEQGVPVVVDVYRSLNLSVEKILPLSTLTAITATLLSLLIPLAIFLQKRPGSDAVETATIQIRIINVKALVFAFVLICFAFLLWGIDSIKMMLLLPYSVGVILILSTLVKSVKWITDWNWEPETGFRSLQQNKLIKKSKLTTNQRKLVWEARLKGMAEVASKNGGSSSYADRLIEEFKTNYEQTDVQNHSWLVNTTFAYVNSEYSKNGWYNYSFFKYSFKVTLNLIRKHHKYVEAGKDTPSNAIYIDLIDELLTWKRNIEGTFKLLGKDGEKEYLLPLVVEEHTQYADNEEAVQFLAELILDSLYQSEYPPILNYGSDWKISYQSLLTDKDRTNTHWTLSRAFLQHIKKEEINNYHGISNHPISIKNDVVFESIFKNADPIFFGQLILLFFVLEAGVISNDPSYIRNRLLVPRSMGFYHSSPTIQGDWTKQQILEHDTNQRKFEEKNTLQLWMLLDNWQKNNDQWHPEYINKLKNLFDEVSQNTEAVSEDEQHKLAGKIKMLRAVIDRVSTLLKEISSS